MYRVAARALVIWLLIVVLLGGLVFFLYEYAMKAEDWVMETGNPNVYDSNGISLGTVLDRDGVLLMNFQNGRTYHPNMQVRMSTLHWLGDRSGNIASKVLDRYEKELADFDFVNGLYEYGTNGGQLTLTLSAQLQAVALEALGNRKGTVAVYNYRTGEILCAVTTPTFDPDNVPDIAGDTAGTYEGIYLNRFMQTVYIPGSIFKIVTTAAALEQIEDIQSRSFTCTGTYSFGADQVSCERAHGTLSIKNAMRSSCNCIYAQIALLLGAENMERYVAQFGVTEQIRFDGLASAAGNFQCTNTADVNLAWSAVGQYKDQINPCAFLTFVGAIANGGKGVEPYVVSSVGAGDTKAYTAQTTMRQRIMSEQTAAVLREFMENNVINNYGVENFPGLTVCAKSGTGEVGGGQRPNAMFAGFVADDAYPLAFIVAVENAGYGKAVCVPILSQVLQACKAMIDAG